MNVDREMAWLMGFIKKLGGPYYTVKSAGQRYDVKCHGKNDINSVISWFTPSTDIKQAFEVVEKLDPAMYYVEVNRVIDGSYTCTIYENPEDWDDFRAFTSGKEDTPAMAICLAALKAKEAK